MIKNEYQIKKYFKHKSLKIETLINKQTNVFELKLIFVFVVWGNKIGVYML